MKNNILLDRLKDSIIYVLLSIIITFLLPVIFKNTYLCFIGIALSVVFIYKTFSFYKLEKSGEYTQIEVICTGKRQDPLNIGMAQNYEFEPVDVEKCSEIINLNIYNDEFKSALALKNKNKIKTGYTYRLLFKNEKDGTVKYNNANFIGFERCVILDKIQE